MGVRFSKSIKVGNYLRLNFSKSGVSATVGKRGASVNVGTKGTYLNLSPSAVGISGTGLSYRQKIAGSSKKKKQTDKKTEKKSSETQSTSSSSLHRKGEENKQEEVVYTADNSIIEEYEQANEARINIHKYADNVLNRQEFAAFVDGLESEAAQDIYELSLAGDEDTIEELVGNFVSNLDLDYEVNCSYELEDNVLYIDLDLPEIEDLPREYPVLSKNEIVYKRKSTAELREEYARTIMSLGVYLAASCFNISSYIDEIVLSAFTTVRDSKGDQQDQYLYSVRFSRDVFENTDLSALDDLYRFLLKFENRINLSPTFIFKAIEPYTLPAQEIANDLVDDAILGLKELGYKVSDINAIVDELRQMELNSSGDYLREGLRLLKENKK